MIVIDQNTCKTCIHYQQHYAFDQRRIFRVYCGHCMLHTARKRRPDSIACDDFHLAAPGEESFITKEYLSKALLQYVLNLELLPPIEDV